jgi:hypothetical protein
MEDETKKYEHKKVYIDVREYGTICPYCGVSDLFLSTNENWDGETAINVSPEPKSNLIECFRCNRTFEVLPIRIEHLGKTKP